MNKIDKQNRINNFGEVFTKTKEVNLMVDLFQNELLRLDSKFLEPTCGEGNFLCEILCRKLKLIETNKYQNPKITYKNIILIVSSIYGIDIIKKNVIKCMLNLEKLVETFIKKNFNEDFFSEIFPTVKVILKKNIIWGNTLNFTIGEKSERLIEFYDWKFIDLDKIKIRKYTYKNLLAYQPIDTPNLFSDLGEEAFVASPEKEFPIMSPTEIFKYVK